MNTHKQMLLPFVCWASAAPAFAQQGNTIEDVKKKLITPVENDSDLRLRR